MMATLASQMLYFKLVNSNMENRGFTYRPGINKTDFDAGACKGRGFYFTDLRNFPYWAKDYALDSFVFRVDIPRNARVHLEVWDGATPSAEWKASAIVLSEKMILWDFIKLHDLADAILDMRVLYPPPPASHFSVMPSIEYFLGARVDIKEAERRYSLFRLVGLAFAGAKRIISDKMAESDRLAELNKKPHI
jgi:hypothetical protein